MNLLIARMILQRMGIVLLTLLIVSFAVFAVTELLPGDVVEILLGQSATPEAVAGLRAAMHLDEPAVIRFVKWLGGLATGDLGISYVNKLGVAELIEGRLFNTLKLGGVTALFAVPLALGLGIMAAMFQGSVFDRVVSAATVTVI
ncbi:MAG: ABC transporter permease, partial [Chromatiales bacterium]|nr:ABC transporter permease [Chromatiales bacterium]